MAFADNLGPVHDPVGYLALPIHAGYYSTINDDRTQATANADNPRTRILLLTSYGSAAGRSHIAPEIRDALAETSSAEQLTNRQLQILELVVRGFANHDIATHLGIREDSVKKHTYAIYAKLGAANRAEAIVIALRKHLLKI